MSLRPPFWLAGLLLATAASADVTGKVTLTGAPRDPDVPIRVNKSDPLCSHAGKIMTENWKIGPGGALAEAVVWVENVPAAAPPASKVLVDQKGCRYEPHVTCICKGATITFRNSDNTLHNIHASEYKGRDANSEEVFNTGQTQGMETDETFDHPGIFKIRCDVHPWMSGWILVTDTPCFAVSGPDGSFRLPGALPDGAYTAQAWHSGFAKPIALPFTVKNGAATFDIQFNAAQAD